MKNRITRRDFLNGTQVAIGASLLTPWASAFGNTPTNFTLNKDYYPPAKTGLRGSHDGSWETMHARVMGQEWKAQKPEKEYDLVVVGGGISGLSSAYYYRKKNPTAKILILDNHDDFGGHAKRNELKNGDDIRLGYGGSESINSPGRYPQAAKDLFTDIGIKLEKFHKYYDKELYASYGLGKAIVFDKETFGEEKTVLGYGMRPWEEFAAEMPMSEKAKKSFIRAHTEKVDYLPGKTLEEKNKILGKVDYETYLREYVKVEEEVIKLYTRWSLSYLGVGIDDIPTNTVHYIDNDMPGVAHTLQHKPSSGEITDIFHFPDGNSSVARLLVRKLIPEAVPGSTMEDVVTTRTNYSKLDQPNSNVNIRLNSTVVHVINTKDGKAVDVTYVLNGNPHTIRAKKCVMACYNSAIPYLCPEMSTAQKEGLAFNVKTPLVITKILVSNWKAFAELKTEYFYYTSGFYKQLELDYPVSIGEYSRSQTPDEPMVLHMLHVPWVPQTEGPDQWRDGRYQIIQTSFEEYEENAKHQLTQALGKNGFDVERDIKAITVNRWSHGYSYYPGFIWDPERPDEDKKPWVIGRQPFGNIHIANSDAGVSASLRSAIAQAHRAVSEILS